MIEVCVAAGVGSEGGGLVLVLSLYTVIVFTSYKYVLRFPMLLIEEGDIGSKLVLVFYTLLIIKSPLLYNNHVAVLQGFLQHFICGNAT